VWVALLASALAIAGLSSMVLSASPAGAACPLCIVPPIIIIPLPPPPPPPPPPPFGPGNCPPGRVCSPPPPPPAPVAPPPISHLPPPVPSVPTTTSTSTTTTTTPVAAPTLTVSPPDGPPGFVTTAVGHNFAPSSVVVLTWSAGIGTTLVPTDATGSFTTGVLIFDHDILGPRNLIATDHFIIAQASFLVVPGDAQPHHLEGPIGRR